MYLYALCHILLFPLLLQLCSVIRILWRRSTTQEKAGRQGEGMLYIILGSRKESDIGLICPRYETVLWALAKSYKLGYSPVCVHMYIVCTKSASSSSTSCWLPPIGEYHLSAAPIYSQVTQHREWTKHGEREIGTAAVAGSTAPGLNSAPPLRPSDLPQTQRAPGVQRLSSIGCLAPI